MRRSELKTELGKHIFDYSPIAKNEIEESVLDEIAASFFLRNEIEEHLRIDKYGQIGFIFFATAEASLKLFTEWTRSFTDFGYHPPILEFTS